MDAASHRTPGKVPAGGESFVRRLGDGRLIGYAQYGDPAGMPVLAFHGTPGCRYMFSPAHAAAARLGLRVIAPDRPGYGLSTPHPRRSLGGWARDMRELAEALELERVGLFGVSGGGPYAAACAALLGERVSFLTLVSPVGPVADPEVAIHLAGGFRRLFLGLARETWASHAAFTAMRWSVRRAPGFAMRGIMARASEADLAILRRREVQRNLLDSLAEGLAHSVSGAAGDLWLFSEPWDFDPGRITAPAVLWQGMGDRNVPPAAARRLAKLIAGCEERLIGDAGHYWIYDNFAAVLEEMRERMSTRV